MLGLPVALLLAVASSAPAGPPPDSVTAFVNVAVLPMDRERVLTAQTVLVQGGRIAAIGPVGQVKIPAQAVRIDGQGKFLIPGLADMHMHLGLSNISGPVAEYENRLAVYLANGVTTIRIMDGGPWHLALRDRVAKGELVGPTIYTSSPQIRSLRSPAEAAKFVADYKAAGYDLIKMYQPDLTLEVLDTFVAAAHRAKMPFGGHVPQGEVKLARWLDAHPRSIEHLNRYPRNVIRLNHPTSRDRELVIDEMSLANFLDSTSLDESRLAAIAAATKRAGVWNVPTQVVYNNPAAVREMRLSEAQHQKLMELRRRVIKALQDAGAGLLIGTDAVTVDGNFPGLSVHWELEAFVAAGLTPYQALAAGTRNVAVFLGTLDRTGTIEVGKRADLALLSGNPLQDIRRTAHPVGVMIGGQWLPREELKAWLAKLGIPDEWS